MDAKKMTPPAGIKGNWHRNRINYSEKEKINFINEAIQGGKSITEFCREKGVGTVFFNKWKKSIVENELKKWNHNGNGYEGDPIVRFEIENNQLRWLIDELKKENELLKHKLDKKAGNDIKLKLN